MSYSRMALGYSRSKKIRAVSDRAFRLWASSIDFADEQNTNGFIDLDDVQLIPRASGSRRWGKRDIEELLSSGLWETADGGWLISSAFWPGKIPKSNWSLKAYDTVFERDGSACRYCGSDRFLSIDHVVPRVQGGSDEADNLVVACRSCNSRKGGRTPEQAGMRLV